MREEESALMDLGFYGEHVERENGAYGSMTLPRQLHVRNHKLYMTPVEEVSLLKGKTFTMEKRRCFPDIDRRQRLPGGDSFSGKYRFFHSFRKKTERKRFRFATMKRDCGL